MKEIIVLRPSYGENVRESRLSAALERALEGREHRVITNLEDFQEEFASKRRDYVNEGGTKRPLRRVLFAVHLGASGINLELFRWLKEMRMNPNLLSNCVGGVIVDGEGDLYTKNIGRQLVLAANACGCAFPGRPYVEGTGSLSNFNIQAKNRNTDVLTAYYEETRDMVGRVLAYGDGVTDGVCTVDDVENCRKPKLLMVHSSRPKTSNTYQLWSLAKKEIEAAGVDVTEVSLRNGEVQDCRGCPYKACMHFGEKGSCFYGGPIVEEVYPALRSCDGLLLLCPNYNDALDANLTAMINRMTALYRQVPFYDKKIFAMIVSGYSGSDIIGGQILGALNMNKAFQLPSKFAAMATANDPGSAMKLPNIEAKMAAYGRHVAAVLKGEEL
ncbi:MAG: NAD(P)H-dependent oxidoreductase [Firmicutes bacterium]|nr:NAD(P)H-dependent oxidoreductase [Bacillota bacterium]